MYKESFVFSQVTNFIPRRQFDTCVNRYEGNYRIRELSCRQQFLALLFGQLTRLESLRDIITCLTAHKKKLYHLGFRKQIARSTLADANRKRDWRIYRDFAYVLITRARKLYVDQASILDELDADIYALDASVIELCLNWFSWASFRKTKGGIKLHVVLDLKSTIPTMFHITNASVHDVNIMDEVVWEKAALYIMDRGYVDYARLLEISSNNAFFIVRAKRNLSFRRTDYRQVDKNTGLRCDQNIRLNGHLSSKRYPKSLRRVKYYDAETDRYYVFLTNNFELDALLVAQLYKYRWQVELFFKWIKQNVKVQIFWGRSEKAVKTQICVAICAYVLVAIIKGQLSIELEMHEILQILSVSMLAKDPLSMLFSAEVLQSCEGALPEQPVLIDF